MSNTLLIAKRDFRAYFSSPIAYIVIAIFLARMGFFFFECLAYFLKSQEENMIMNTGPKPTITQAILGNWFMHMNILLIIFFIPFITMRLFSEERRDGTEYLLLSAPIAYGSIIWGKFLAAFAFVFVMLSGTFPYAIVLILSSNVDIGVLCTAYLGTIICSAAAISIGLFWSSTTENQIVAAVTTMGTLLSLWLVAMSSYRAGPGWSDILRYVSVTDHLQSFVTGVIDTSDLIYFALLIVFGFFGTFVSFDASQRG